ncbi:kynurenine 3-monooxygenase [Pseudalgibacter alginicilyticus]|uniref:Kynurenine 3-monooxygenase n=1 Tax=Pseudalgibacter alginicilyticus TaxID=1736674 RepID=A0A0P0DBD3_9FLAO|nr:NAD(P)/FAD-dependent oxidoreductase [Pseudalgibacter alginicilyticus]ALJ06229.1 kynurenine 3-monooxygenase [Pseudalgibacter alginicilyticus]
MNKQQNILIIGAGLCGALLALRLGQRGYNITLIEMRPDLRKVDISEGRSINLAISDRGIKAMKLVGIQNKVKSLCIPMLGRMIHDTDGNTFLSKYSGRDHEYISSVSRQDLTALLMNEAEALENVTLIFNKKCKHVDFENKQATFIDYATKAVSTIQADVIFGTDGAGSSLRKSYYSERKFLFNFSQNFLKYGYKELSILPAENNAYKTEKNALHIWPRGDFMLIALPNLDGSFTVTLFLSYDQGSFNFSNLTTPEMVTRFFEKEFPDALKLMPHLIDDFFNNPTSPLGTIKCSPWHYQDHTLLMGDAAHAIAPFYGQGMNASFEDVVVLDALIENHKGNWETIFKTFSKTRKKDTDAIADLAIDNFLEMKEHVSDPIFQEKRKLEIALEKEFPNKYASKYALVTFNENIGYHEAMTQGRAQDKAILNLLKHKYISFDDDLKSVLKIIKQDTKKIIDKDNLLKNIEEESI